MKRGLRVIVLLWVCAALAGASSKNQELSDFTTRLPLKPGDTLILGIVGGWERWDAPQRGVRKTALELRELHIPGLYIETVENHKLNLATELVHRAFPGPSAQSARIILYGHSFGGMSAVRFARELQAERIPVLLIVLVDAVGRNRPIPANVREAANFYQRESCPICGPKQIRAEDPVQTRIVGSFAWHSKGKTIDMGTEPWVRRFFVRGHELMEFDPAMWTEVKDLIMRAAGAGLRPSR